MKRVMILLAALTVGLAILFGTLYVGGGLGLFLSLAVTFGTVGYHLIMRLLVGLAFNLFMGNRADYTQPWFCPRPWEKKLYDRLGVKGWKTRLPTFNPDLFNPKKRTWDEIAQAMCQAELVHETILPLSFVPILFSRWFGALGVFIATSLGGALLDLAFVILQRYNRPRIIRLIERQR